ncbi:MAG: SDR family NAD(P)-dependent oxidoreductase [Ruminococcus flavefaciens]|nr:SDR family NAD(P)-dependent oxidoreductase [Ruminococcus flavefaciens]MCM1361137.1 SDR family NAD(P)-dependent oxidoreductase [Clostridiales bacterium]MCM1434953.1 SDR family NAD(P)-dependent oxidoreductase [Ruminococcus flavefaciens]
MKAFITGATSGIGKKIAEKLSEMGWELVLTGRNKEVLEEMQLRLGKTEIIFAELSDKNEVFRVYEFCKGKNIDMLVNNAGYGLFGRFDEIDLDDEINMINVNITALHILTKLFLRDFKKRNRGIILNVASVAGFMTGPLLSSYYASKNYVLRLSLGIYEELRRDRSKVSVTVLCPGPVDTEFNNRAGVSFSAKPITADFAAEYAIKKALSGKLFAIPGLTAKFCAVGQRFVPQKLLSAVTYEIQYAKKTSGSKERNFK